MTFFAKQKKDTDALIIYLNSGAIEAGFFSFNSKKSSQDFYARENLKQTRDIDSKILEEETLSALRKVLHKIFGQVKKEGIKIDRIFFLLGATWYLSNEINIEIKKNKNFFVNKDEVIKELELKNLSDNTDFVTVESIITSIKANGYEIKDLKGKRTKHLTASALVNIAERRVVRKFEAEIKKYFSRVDIKVNTLSVLSADIIAKTIDKKDFLLVISEDEITEIAYVRNSEVASNISIPVGKNYFLRSLLDANLAKDWSSANTILKMFEDNHLEKNKKTAVDEVLQKASREYLNTLREGLFGSFSRSKHPDAIVILSSSSEINPILKNIFNDYYISSKKTGNLVKTIVAKNRSRSASFEVAVSGIKNLYF